MQKIFCLFSIVLLLSQLFAGQTNDAQAAAATPPQAASQSLPQSPPVVPTDVTTSRGFILEDATPVRLRFNRAVSSSDSQVNETVDFQVLQDLRINGTPVILKGSLAFGTVTEAQSKRRLARGGKLEINVDYVRLFDGEKAPLRAVHGGKGGSHVGYMTAGIVASGLIFFPAAPFFLFMQGKDMTIPKGAEVTAYVNGDVKLDPAKFEPGAPNLSTRGMILAMRPPMCPAMRPTKATNLRMLQVDSTPAGADINIDGKFVGNTPSGVRLEEGSHMVIVKKPGFKHWRRKVKITAGSDIHLNAELEKPDY